jgi:hypothetical protein
VIQDLESGVAYLQKRAVPFAEVFFLCEHDGGAGTCNDVLEKRMLPGRPRPSKIIFMAYRSIPGKFPEKSEKVVSLFCGGRENYLTNRGIDAIVPPLKTNPPAGLAVEGCMREMPKIQFAYDLHLPPLLRFDKTGKADGLPELLQIVRSRPLNVGEGLLGEAKDSEKVYEKAF